MAVFSLPPSSPEPSISTYSSNANFKTPPRASCRQIYRQTENKRGISLLHEIMHPFFNPLAIKSRDPFLEVKTIYIYIDHDRLDNRQDKKRGREISLSSRQKSNFCGVTGASLDSTGRSTFQKRVFVLFGSYDFYFAKTSQDSLPFFSETSFLTFLLNN